MLKIRWSLDHLIFNMGISVPGKDTLYIEKRPRFLKDFNTIGTSLPPIELPTPQPSSTSRCSLSMEAPLRLHSWTEKTASLLGTGNHNSIITQISAYWRVAFHTDTFSTSDWRVVSHRATVYSNSSSFHHPKYYNFRTDVYDTSIRHKVMTYWICF